MGANPTTVLKTTTTKETSTTTIQDCDCGSEREYCNACADLRDNSSEFYTNGVTDAVCESLQDNKGFNTESAHDNCDDLHLANDCLIEPLIEKLPAYDVCDWKEFMGEMLPNVYNMYEAMICWMCGIEKRVSQVALNNIDLELRVLLNQTSHPGADTWNINRDGTFVFRSSDWLSDTQKYANIEIYGSVNFCFGIGEHEKLVWQIKSATLSRVKYTVVNSSASYPTRTFKIPNKNGTTIWQKVCNSSFDENINKTVNIGTSGTVDAGKNSDWMTFMWQYGDWVIDGEVEYQIRFLNNNKDKLPTDC